MALLELFLNANLLFTVEDRPTLPPTFKVGGQVLTSARLHLVGSSVEAVLITNFDSQLADAAR